MPEAVAGSGADPALPALRAKQLLAGVLETLAVAGASLVALGFGKTAVVLRHRAALPCGRRPARRLCRPLRSPPGCDNSGGQVPWRCRDIPSKTRANECRGSRIHRLAALPRESTRPLDLIGNRPAQGGSVKPASASPAGVDCGASRGGSAGAW